VGRGNEIAAMCSGAGSKKRIRHAPDLFLFREHHVWGALLKTKEKVHKKGAKNARSCLGEHRVKIRMEKKRSGRLKNVHRKIST